MAELHISLPEIPKSTDTDAGSSRRYSTGKPSSSRIGEKVVPNYLRASTGSCHDFCKYGRKHAFEEKARPPFLRRKAKKPPDEENSSNFQPEGNMVLKIKHNPNSNSQQPRRTPEVIKGEVSPISLNKRAAVSSSGMGANKISSRVLFTKSVDRQNPVLMEVLAKKKTAAREVLTASIDSQRSVSSENRVERRNSLAPERKQTAARTLLTKSVDSQSSISGEFDRRKAGALERKKVSAAPEKNQTVARKLLKESIDSQSSISGEFERRKADALERKKASAIKLRTSLDSKTHLPPKTIKQGMSSPSGKLKVSSKQVASKVIEEDVSAKRASSSKLRLSLPDSSRISSGRRNSDSTYGKKTLTSKIAGKRVHTSPRASLSPNSSIRGIVKGQGHPKASLSLKPTLKVQLSSKALLSPKTSSTGIARAMASPRASMSSKPLSRVTSLNTRNHESSEVLSPLQNLSKIEKGNNKHSKIMQAEPDQFTEELEGPNNDAAQEKTLHVIKMETENKVLASDHNENLSAELSSPPLLSAKSPSLPESSMSSSHYEDGEESEYTVADTEDDLVSEYDETESVEEAHPLEEEQKRMLRKAGLLHLEDKESQPFKLRFRQGRVIEIQPEHNTPRRLKFRQGRGIGENQNFKSDGRRSFKRRGADGHAIDSNPNSEKVVLRHQDAEGKKDAQGLLNNVIEETASKLVETRKSKVKALVGAFETVISLQDGKPTANTAS